MQILVNRRFSWSPRLRILALFAALIAAWPSFAGPVDDGITAFERGDLATAYRLLERPAEAGDPPAQFTMGGLAQAGRGKGAARWFERAMAQGHADSFVAMGYLRGLPKESRGCRQRRCAYVAARWCFDGCRRYRPLVARVWS